MAQARADDRIQVIDRCSERVVDPNGLLYTPGDYSGQIPATCRRAFDPVLAGPELDLDATH